LNRREVDARRLERLDHSGVHPFLISAHETAAVDMDQQRRRPFARRLVKVEHVPFGRAIRHVGEGWLCFGRGFVLLGRRTGGQQRQKCRQSDGERT